MKLKNKKTGEIVEWFNNTDGVFPNSLAELNEEWEDYEEKPKGYWFIDAYGNIVQNEITKHYGDEYIDMTDAYESQKQIGNHFETPEEAEKAVEKLQAWKRLNNCGLKFIDWWLSKDNHIIIGTNRQIFDIDEQGLREDLDLLFSGKDD